MLPRNQKRDRWSWLVLSFLAGFGASVASYAAGEIPGNDAPAAPPAADEAKSFLTLPFRSAARTDWFVEVATLRYLCPRGYSALEGGNEVPCARTTAPGTGTSPPAVDEGRRGRAFVRRVGPGVRWSLDLVTIPSPVGGYELYFFGKVSGGADDGKPNSDLASVKSDFDALLKNLAAAPLGTSTDGILSYQLSNEQADRAVAVLKTLGYPVIEYTKSGDPQKPLQTVYDNIFDELPPRTTSLLSRPAIIKLIDSESTSLVQDTNTLLGGGDTELAGGQRLSSVADGAPQQRLLIVFDRTDLEALDVLLARLQKFIDVPARQILIEAVVIELEDDRLLDFGVDFSGSKDNYGTSFDESGGVIQPFTFTFDRPHPLTLLQFSAKLRALVNRGRAKVLSRPSVFVLDGRQAKIKVGDNVPYSSLSVSATGVVLSSTTYLKTGIILNLRPRAASSNSDVTMQVETIISTPGPSQIQNGILIAPTIQSRQVQTLVRVANDTPFVIGGLIAQTDQKTINGIPVLSSIPILGALFRKQTSVNNRKEVIVVITPHIVASDDPTLSYSIPRDAGGADTNGGWSGLKRRGPLFGASAESCDKSYPALEPRVLRTARHDEVSIFDSFDLQLFRNVYRVRSSDILDFGFIREEPTVKEYLLKTQELAKDMTSAQFTRLPAIDPADLEGEVTRRLRKEVCGDEKVDCLPPEQVRTFLALFNGDIPGEEILVNNMIIRIIEDLGVSAFIPPENMLFFNQRQKEGEKGLIHPESLMDEAFIRDCLRDNKTIVMAFPPDQDPAAVVITHREAEAAPVAPPEVSPYGQFNSQCLQPGSHEEPGGASDTDPGRFPPPTARLICMSLDKEKYIETLRKCNKSGWQAILLNQTFCEGRKRNPVALLQSVLALKRLLELNDSKTFPRTLRAFHVGRELVFPTQRDLETRRHLIDRRTAQLFYETLDYYRAFDQAYVQMKTKVEKPRDILISIHAARRASSPPPP
jgi:hypothetical protein